jgi:hypothetical protein
MGENPMITAEQRITRMQSLMAEAERYEGWKELTPAREAILAFLRARVARSLDGYAADGNYNWLVWVRPGATVEEFVFFASPAIERREQVRTVRRRKRELAHRCLWNGDGHWTFGCDSNPRRITIADKPGRISAMAEIRRYERMMIIHGDALASVLQVMRNR